MNFYLSHSGLFVPSATLKGMMGKSYAVFLKKLTLTHYPKVGPPVSAKQYAEVVIGGVDCICLPRTFAKPFAPHLEILFQPVRKINAKLCIDLFDNQRILVDYLVKTVYTPQRIAAGTACAILNLRAGLGKTFAAAGLIAELGMRTLYIVPNQPLANQGTRDLQCCFTDDEGHANANVCRWKGKNCDTTHHNITVMVVNSAIARPPEFFSQYSLIIIDEVHMFCSEKRREIFRRITHASLGMSATTENRRDGFDGIAHKELAFDGIVRAEEVPGFTYEDVEFRCVVEAVRYNGPAEFTRNLSHESTGRLFTPYMITQFLKDPHRMRLAVRKIKQLYDWESETGQKHNIYVFCEERDPLAEVRRLLEAEIGAVDAPEIGTFIGGIKDSQITDIKANARILLTTYGYSGTGVSIDKMTAIVFLTPRRSNMLQILARILRRGGDLSIERRVVDIIDNRTALRAQHAERRLAYDFYGMEMIHSKETVEN